jgi:glycerol kinase
VLEGIAFQNAEILGIRLRRTKYLETTSLGAIFAAGIGAGVWTDLERISETWQEDRQFLPAIDENQRTETLRRWNTAVKRVLLPA